MRIWNQLPGYIKCAWSIDIFMKLLKHHLFELVYNQLLYVIFWLMWFFYIFCAFFWSALVPILFLVKALSIPLIDWLIDWLIEVSALDFSPSCTRTTWFHLYEQQELDICARTWFMLLNLKIPKLFHDKNVMWSSKMSRNSQILFLRYSQTKPIFSFVSYCLFNSSTVCISLEPIAQLLWGFHQT